MSRSDAAIPDRIDLGLAVVHVRKDVPIAQMREVTGCEPDDETPDGTWDVDTDTIYLRKGLRGGHRRRVFWHELVHAVIDLDYQSVETKR